MFLPSVRISFTDFQGDILKYFFYISFTIEFDSLSNNLLFIKTRVLLISLRVSEKRVLENRAFYRPFKPMGQTLFHGFCSVHGDP
jgi:hypothetical protein